MDYNYYNTIITSIVVILYYNKETLKGPLEYGRYFTSNYIIYIATASNIIFVPQADLSVQDVIVSTK